MKYSIEGLRALYSKGTYPEGHDILDLLEEGATIIEHLRKNIPRGWIVDAVFPIHAFLDKLKKEKG